MEIERGQFEQSLIRYLASQPHFAESYDKVADYLTTVTGKTIDGRKVNFLSRGDAYAKRWLLEGLLKAAMDFGWVPYSLKDWQQCKWISIGDREHFDPEEIEKVSHALSQFSGKPAKMFEQAYAENLREHKNGH